MTPSAQHERLLASASLPERIPAGIAFFIVIASLCHAANAQMLPRNSSTGVQLISEGRPACAIVYPASDPAWQPLARLAADGLQALGATDVPIFADTIAVPERFGELRSDLRDRSLILLGDLNTNRAVFPLYANYYTCCDGSYPGGGGYVLRTIVRPFGRPHNHLLIGGSTIDEVAAGVARFRERLRDLQPSADIDLPYCLEVKLGPSWASIFDPLIAATRATDSTTPPAADIDYGLARDRFAEHAHLYFYTGDEAFARHARAWALHLVERDPEGIRTDDYRLENLAMAWRRVSVSPSFSAEERHTIDARIYQTAALQERSWWRQKSAAHGIGGRHHTTGMLAWWTLLRVLLETGEPDEVTRTQLTQWRAEAETYLDGLLRHYWDDLDDYQSADSVQNTASYALQTGKLWWYTDGLAERAAQKLVSLTDNLGWYAGVQGYGEALPGWERFTLDGGLLLGSCAFIHQDGRYRWLLERFPNLQHSWGALQPWGLHQYDTGGRLDVQPPEWLSGLQVLRFTPYRLELLNRGDFLNTPLMDGYRVKGLAANPVPEDQAFDKAVIRGGLDGSDPYLLLQGSAGIALSVIDMNAIVRFTDQGKLWLVHNTGRPSLYFKNALYVTRGFNDPPAPATCHLLAHRAFDDASLLSSRLPDYRGTTWTRSILALHGHFIVVIDHVRAEQPGDYIFCNTWRTPMHAKLDGATWQSRQENVTFRLLASENFGLSSNRLSQPDGATRPTVLRQSRSFSATRGEALVYENLFYTSSPERDVKIEVRRIAPGTIAIRETGPAGESIHVAAAGDKGIDLPGLRTDAQVILTSPDGARTAGGTYVQIDQTRIPITSDPITFDSALHDGAAGVLHRLWNEAQPAAMPQEGPADSTATSRGPPPRWTHAGPATRGPLVEGIRAVPINHATGCPSLATDRILPVLRAEPRLSPHRGSGLSLEGLSPRSPSPSPSSAPAGQAGTRSPVRDEPVEFTLSPARNAEFLIQLPAPTLIGEISLFGDTLGEISTPLPPATLRLELTFSLDGFDKDRRVRMVDCPREPTYHNLYKGHSYLFECFRAVDLNESASTIRVRVLDVLADEMILTDVQVRSAISNLKSGITNHEFQISNPESQISNLRFQISDFKPLVHARPIDLDHDNSDEILTWTADGDLLGLNGDGSERWRRRWPAGILAVDAWDLDGDEWREIFVSRLDRHVVVLNADGTPRWEKDFTDMVRQTDGRFYGDGSLVYGMAAWQPQESPTASPGEAPHDAPQHPSRAKILFTSYFFTARLDAGGQIEECFRRSGHFTQIRAMPDALPEAGGLAIRSDIPWIGPVPLQWWSPKTGQPFAESSVPNGPAVFFELGDFDADRQVDALFASEQGIGLYAPTEPKTRWEQITDAPITGVGLIRDPTSGSFAAITYAREDGYIFAVKPDGILLHQAVLGEPIACLTAVSGNDKHPVIVVGTKKSLRGLAWPDLTEQWRSPTPCQSLHVLREDAREAVLAVHADGRLSRIDP